MMKTCPYCAEEIQDTAIVCKHCRRDLTKSPEVYTQQKTELVQKLSDLEKKLAEWEQWLAEQNLAAQQANQQKTWAYVGAMISVFLIPAFGIGVIGGLICVVIIISENGKLKQAEVNQTKARDTIKTIQSRLAELKAEMALL